jgi:hypothetical protein
MLMSLGIDKLAIKGITGLTRQLFGKYRATPEWHLHLIIRGATEPHQEVNRK